MMRQEYEELAGIRIGCLFYDEMIEPLYNALPDFVSKQDFAKIIDARKAQALFYKEMIAKGSLGILNGGTLMALFTDLEYLEVIEKAFPQHFFYYDTDSIKKCFKGGYTHAKPMKESEDK